MGRRGALGAGGGGKRGGLGRVGAGRQSPQPIIGGIWGRGEDWAKGGGEVALKQ